MASGTIVGTVFDFPLYYKNRTFASGVTSDTPAQVIDAAGTWTGLAITNANIDPSLSQYASIPLSSAQILALNATPVTLVAAPGAGKTIIVQDVLFTMTTTATAYASGGNVTFQYSGGNAVTNNVASTVVTAAAGTSYTVRQAIDVTAAVNTALTVTNATGAFTTGTGTALINVCYRIV